MGNYSLSVNSKFQPMSLESMLVPYLKYAEAYKEQEDALTELDAKTALYEGIINQNKGSESAKMYQSYLDNIKAQSEDLATNGLTLRNRKSLQKLKSSYFSKVQPIETAYKAKSDMIKAQDEDNRKAQGKMIYTSDARNISLDAFLNGQVPNYGSLNLDDLYKESAQGAAALSSRYFGTKESNAFDGKFLDYIKTNGIDIDNIDKVLDDIGTNNANPKYKEFANLVRDMKERYGYESFSAADKKKFMSSILQGLNTGMVYKVDHGLSADPDRITPLQAANLSIARANLELGRQAQVASFGMKGFKVNDKGEFVIDDTPAFKAARKAARDASRKTPFDLGEDVTAVLDSIANAGESAGADDM